MELDKKHRLNTLLHVGDPDSTKAIETDPNYKKKREYECGIFFD